MIAVCDTETTGDGELDQVIDFAAVCVDQGPQGWAWVDSWCTLVRPTVPVTIGARAVHHITDPELSTAPTQAEARKKLEAIFARADYTCFHNAAFDIPKVLATWPDLRVPLVIDTYRLARRLCPGAPSHSNQVLRYWLGVEGPLRDLPPHRALPDAQVTAGILCRFLCDHSPEELAEMTSQPIFLEVCPWGQHRGKPWSDIPWNDKQWMRDRPDLDPDLAHTLQQVMPQHVPLLLDTIPFGKHRGTKFSEVPRDYLRWCLGQGFDCDIVHTIRHTLGVEKA